ncbi:MAG: SoxR reducing system RseC family protein [Gammaproteobacteria bacterium]
MIKEQATVTGLDGNMAVVEMQRQGICGHCELNKGCGTGAIGRLLGHRSKPLMIENHHALKPGDSLTLGLSDKFFLQASLLIYGLPLLGLIIGGLLAQSILGLSEILVFVFAATGFMAGFRYSARIAGNRYLHRFHPKILEVRGEPGDGF